MKHEKYDEYFVEATAVMAEGARIGLCTCRICGAAIMFDPRDQINAAQLHAEWHDATDAARGKG